MRSSSNNGRYGGRKSNFDLVPADDGFRNYMARKIEMQRKQFGLVVPPPPPSPSQHDNGDSSHADDANESKNDNIEHAVINDETISSSQFANAPQMPSNSPPAKKKSVRFHSDIETTASAHSVSDILTNLKQRHSVIKPSKTRFGKLSRRSQDGEASTRSTTARVTEQSTPQYKSVLGVLDVLQKNHGTPSTRRKRKSSVSPKASVLESLDDSAASSSVDDGTSSKRRRESSRHSKKSVLEGLHSDDDGVSSSTNQTIQDGGKVTCKESDDSKATHSHAEGEPSTKQTHHDAELSKPFSFHASDIYLTKQSPSIEIAIHSSSIKRKPNYRPDLFFAGVVILVNGHTSPDATTLMRLLHKHGGDLEKYETHRVTHIIAECLSTAKAKIYKKQRKPTPVCRPEWIVDSVKKGVLLPYADYLLDDVMDKDTFGTKSVKTFFSENNCNRKAMASCEEATKTGVVSSPKQAQRSPVEDSNSSPDVTSSKNRWQDTDKGNGNYLLNGQVRTVGNDPNFLDS